MSWSFALASSNPESIKAAVHKVADQPSSGFPKSFAERICKDLDENPSVSDAGKEDALIVLTTSGHLGGCNGHGAYSLMRATKAENI